MRIVSVGTRFFPHLHAGDKNFWLYLFREFANRGDEVHVISLDAHSAPPATVVPRFTLETLKATPVYMDSRVHRHRYNPESREIPALTNYVSRTISWPGVLRRLNQLIREWNPDVIHFMDNLGPASFGFARAVHRPSFVSAITYDPRHRYYDWLLMLSVRGFDGIAVTSDVFRNRMEAIGIPAGRVHTVRWGADPKVYHPPPDKAAAKRAIRIDPEVPVALWSGFIQQTTQPDFYTAYYALVEARKSIPNLVGVFCLKPQHFQPLYRTLEGPGIRVHGDAESFALAQEAADVFLGPISRDRSILAPPLTWVECMMKGLPILTNPCGAAEEVLGNGEAGIVAAPDKLGSALLEVLSDRNRLSELQRSTIAWGTRMFSLEGSVQGYRDLWKSAR